MSHISGDRSGHGQPTALSTSRENGAVGKGTQGNQGKIKWELQSLTGQLQHACKVVRQGRAFIQRLYALQSVGSAPSYNIRLNTVVRADIVWWQLFVS